MFEFARHAWRVLAGSRWTHALVIATAIGQIAPQGSGAPAPVLFNNGCCCTTTLTNMMPVVHCGQCAEAPVTCGGTFCEEAIVGGSLPGVPCTSYRPNANCVVTQVKWTPKRFKCGDPISCALPGDPPPMGAKCTVEEKDSCDEVTSDTCSGTICPGNWNSTVGC